MSLGTLSRVEVVGLRHVARQIAELDNGGSYTRNPGWIIDAPEWIADGHEKQARLSKVSPPPALVATLQDVVVHSRCVIATATGQIVRESLINTENLLDFGPFRREIPGGLLSMLPAGPLVRYENFNRLVLLKQMWDNNYGHWLIETLPRVGMVAERFDLAACRFLIGGDGGPISHVYRDTLQLLGVPSEHIIALPDETVAFGELVYPAPITVQPWVKAPRVIGFLERLGARVAPGSHGPDRVYISRGPGERRALRNEASLRCLLEGAGYHLMVNPVSMDFATQVRMFSNATHVVGILGAGFTNVVFAPRGVQVLALTTEFMQDDFFWDLVSQKQGTYTSLHGKAIDPDDGMQSDFTIDYETFRVFFAAFDPVGISRRKI